MKSKIAARICAVIFISSGLVAEASGQDLVPLDQLLKKPKDQNLYSAPSISITLRPG